MGDGVLLIGGSKSLGTFGKILNNVGFWDDIGHQNQWLLNGVHKMVAYNFRANYLVTQVTWKVLRIPGRPRIPLGTISPVENQLKTIEIYYFYILTSRVARISEHTQIVNFYAQNRTSFSHAAPNFHLLENVKSWKLKRIDCDSITGIH